MKLKTLFLILILLLVSITRVFAEADFAVILNSKYEFNETGLAKVYKNFELVNLTTGSYPTSFNLNLPNDANSLIAFDNVGKIEPKIEKEKNSQKITLTLNEVSVGINKSVHFAVTYLTKSFYSDANNHQEIIIPAERNDLSFVENNVEVVLPDAWSKTALVKPVSKKRLFWTMAEMNNLPIEIDLAGVQKNAQASVSMKEIQKKEYSNMIMGIVLGVAATFAIYLLFTNFRHGKNKTL